MKTLLHILACSLFILPQALAQNTVYGSGAGNGGTYNTHIGYTAGRSSTGTQNTFLGSQAGLNNQSGNSNVFIGFRAGYSETGSNKLYIDNKDDKKPLLYGNFSSNVLSIGKKYTGTAYKLDIPGKVRATAYDVVSDERLKKVAAGSLPAGTYVYTLVADGKPLASQKMVLSR